jgi:chromosome segregation ATPase
MVLAIKEKFQEMNENVRLAEKKAYEDVAKSFKNLTQKITSLIK